MSPSRKNLIALLTDFGPRGQHYVASMKGTILSINLDCRILDISHNLTSYSIIEGAYLLSTTYQYFPRGTIFVVVVDPRVGSAREIVALKTKSEFYFVGPDNGVFTPILEGEELEKCIRVENVKYFKEPISNTFHGRDIMAPVGAHLSKGVSLAKFGPAVAPKDLTTHSLTLEIKSETKKITCCVQFVDSFGNITTNVALDSSYSFGDFTHIRGTNIPLKEGSSVEMIKDNQEYSAPIVSHFAEASKGTLVALRGSNNFLEFSLNQGNAAEYLGLTVGDVFNIQLSE